MYKRLWTFFIFIALTLYAVYIVLTSLCFDVKITSPTLCLYNIAYLTSRDLHHNVLVYFV